MDEQAILTLLEHGALAAVLFFLLQRVMDRLNAVTDKLIDILDRQEKIQAQMLANHLEMENVKKPRHSDV